MGAACIDLVYLRMSIYYRILGAGLVWGRGVSGVCRLGCGGGREMLVWWGEWFFVVVGAGVCEIGCGSVGWVWGVPVCGCVMVIRAWVGPGCVCCEHKV